MIQRTPIRRKRAKPRVIHPERSGSGHKRERLHGKAKTERRQEIFERSGGRCEASTGEMICRHGDIGLYFRCGKRITLESMHWSHKRHAANKCDCMECGIASCAECHLVGVHNPKPIRVTKKSLSFGTEVKDGEK